MPLAQSRGCDSVLRALRLDGAAHERIGEEEVTGDVLEDRRVGRGDVELAQLDLGRGPGEVEGALGGVRIVVAAGQLEGALAAWSRPAW